MSTSSLTPASFKTGQTSAKTIGSLCSSHARNFSLFGVFKHGRVMHYVWSHDSCVTCQGFFLCDGDWSGIGHWRPLSSLCTTCPTLMAEPLILGPQAVTGVLLGARTSQGSYRTQAVHRVPLARILLAILREEKVARGQLPLTTGINPTIRKIASMAGKKKKTLVCKSIYFSFSLCTCTLGHESLSG